MPGLWKVWKAKSRLPTLSTSPLEISPKGGEIPTFPQLRQSVLEKWKTKTRFPTFPSRFAIPTPGRSPQSRPAAFGRAAALRSASAQRHLQIR